MYKEVNTIKIRCPVFLIFNDFLQLATSNLFLNFLSHTYFLALNIFDQGLKINFVEWMVIQFRNANFLFLLS